MRGEPARRRPGRPTVPQPPPDAPPPGETGRRRPRIVVVGAGFGGLAAAKALAKLPVEVTVVDRRNHHLFQPLLYQVATAALSPAEIAAPIRSIFRRDRKSTRLNSSH